MAWVRHPWHGYDMHGMPVRVDTLTQFGGSANASLAAAEQLMMFSSTGSTVIGCQAGVAPGK